MERRSNPFYSFNNPGHQTSNPVLISWSFVFSVLAFIVASLGIAGCFFWYLSYGFDFSPPGSISVSHISQPADIAWHTNGLATITSDDLPASLAAMGYVHATQNPWQMMLWRQTALGTLSAWFGPGLLSLDRLNRQLRFSQLAEATFRKLPREKQLLLEAYASGVNAAIHEKNLLSHNEFAFLGTDIAPWQPWHTLTVERLFAWMATQMPDMGQTPEVDFATFLETLNKSDKALHEFLQIHGFEYSFAGAWHESDAREMDYFYLRFVFGASAPSIIQEVFINLSSQPALFISTIPGTFIFLSGHGEKFNWALLPTSNLTRGKRPTSTKPVVSHERITNRDGTEFLATFSHFPGFLSLPEKDNEPADSTDALFWSGFEEGTDSFAFLDMLTGNKPAFKIFRENGLWFENQEYSPLGVPGFVHNFNKGLLISESPWVTFMAAHMDSLTATRPELLNPKTWATVCYNPWAARHAPSLFAGITTMPALSDPLYQEAITYLRNWDYSYASSSIGAAIFESWLTHLGLTTASSRLNMPARMDSTRRSFTFKQTIDSLSTAFGADLSQWRLEKTKPVYRYFPAWASDSLFSPDKTPLSETSYAPLIFPGKADAATLCSGSFASEDFGAVSAQWETWSVQKDGKSAWFWRKQVTPVSFLDRYLISNRPGVEYHMTSDEDAVQHTKIKPAS